MYALLPTNLFIVVSSVPGHLCPFLRWRFDTPGVFFVFSWHQAMNEILLQSVLGLVFWAWCGVYFCADASSPIAFTQSCQRKLAGRLSECTSFSALGCWKRRMILGLHDLFSHDRDNRRLIGSLIFETKSFEHAVQWWRSSESKCFPSMIRVYACNCCTF